MLRITFNTVVRYYDSARNGVGQSRSKVVECVPSRFRRKFSYVVRDCDNFELQIFNQRLNDITLFFENSFKNFPFTCHSNFTDRDRKKIIRLSLDGDYIWIYIIVKNGAKLWYSSFDTCSKKKKKDKIFPWKIINVHYDRWYHLSMEN